MPCSNVNSWEDVATCVCFLYVETGDGSVYFGSAALINKAGNYSASDKPFVLTAGHNLCMGGDQSDYNQIMILVNYEDHICGDIYMRDGVYAGNLSIKEYGTSSLVAPTDPNYKASQDFCFLQADKVVGELAKSNIEYAGWYLGHNFISEGYAYIGHPAGSVKTVNIENSYALHNPYEQYAAVYNDFGISEYGFSGSPLFNGSSRKLVGWVCTTDNSKTTCSDGAQYTKCGVIDDIYSTIRNYIDPGLIGSASSSNPTQDVLPDHCSNCIKDGDETSVDCGGSCQPCGMADEFYASKTEDIYGREKINARFNLDVMGNGEQVLFQDGNFHLNAGESILLKNAKISNNVAFKASVDESLKFAEQQGCQSACVSISNFVGQSPSVYSYFITADLSYVRSYKVKVINRWGGLVYESGWENSYANETVAIWDGSGVNPGA